MERMRPKATCKKCNQSHEIANQMQFGAMDEKLYATLNGCLCILWKPIEGFLFPITNLPSYLLEYTSLDFDVQ